MSRFVVLLCLDLLVRASGSTYNALQVKYGAPGLAYFDMPWTLSEALKNGMSRGTPLMYDSKLKVHLVSWKEDPRFFLLYDRQGTIAGVRFGFRKGDVNRVAFLDDTPSPFEEPRSFIVRWFLYVVLKGQRFIESIGYPERNQRRKSEDEVVRGMRKVEPKFRYNFPTNMYSSGRYWNYFVWHTSVLFVNPDILKKGGRPNLNKDTDDVVSALYYWADSTWHHVAPSECDVTAELSEQGCYSGMGKHYFYKTDESTSCADWQGFFAIYNNGVLSGFGVSVFGSFRSTFFTPTYYDHLEFPTIKSILRSRPECMDEWLPLTGVTSVHVFLTRDAANTVCPEVDWRKTNCNK